MSTFAKKNLKKRFIKKIAKTSKQDFREDTTTIKNIMSEQELTNDVKNTIQSDSQDAILQQQQTDDESSSPPVSALQNLIMQSSKEECQSQQGYCKLLKNFGIENFPKELLKILQSQNHNISGNNINQKKLKELTETMMGVNCLCCQQIIDNIQQKKVAGGEKKKMFPYISNKNYVNMLIDKAKRNKKSKEKEEKIKQEKKQILKSLKPPLYITKKEQKVKSYLVQIKEQKYTISNESSPNKSGNKKQTRIISKEVKISTSSPLMKVDQRENQFNPNQIIKRVSMRDKEIQVYTSSSTMPKSSKNYLASTRDMVDYTKSANSETSFSLKPLNFNDKFFLNNSGRESSLKYQNKEESARLQSNGNSSSLSIRQLALETLDQINSEIASQSPLQLRKAQYQRNMLNISLPALSSRQTSHRKSSDNHHFKSIEQNNDQESQEGEEQVYQRILDNSQQDQYQQQIYQKSYFYQNRKVQQLFENEDDYQEEQINESRSITSNLSPVLAKLEQLDDNDQPPLFENNENSEQPLFLIDQEQHQVENAQINIYQEENVEAEQSLRKDYEISKPLFQISRKKIRSSLTCVSQLEQVWEKRETSAIEDHEEEEQYSQQQQKQYYLNQQDDLQSSQQEKVSHSDNSEEDIEDISPFFSLKTRDVGEDYLSSVNEEDESTPLPLFSNTALILQTQQ